MTMAGAPDVGNEGSPSSGQSVRFGAGWVAWVWLVSRLAFVLVALILLVQAGGGLADFPDLMDNWDVEHFLGLATEGYQTTGDDAKRMAFFPGLPLLLAPFIALGVPGEIAGLLLSAIGSAAASAALYRMGGFWAAALWLVAPAAVFGFVPYTEAIFCAFAFWAWERARKDQWALAALLAAGACAIRVSGVFLVGALGIMILTWPMEDGSSCGQRLAAWVRRAIWLVIPAATVVGYLFYLFLLTGSWSAWSDAQQAGWSRAWTLPTQAILRTIQVIQSDAYDDRPGWDLVFGFEIVSFAVGLLAVGWLWRRRQWAEMSWIAVQLLAFSLSEWLMSVNRAVLLWFPVWLIAAELVRRTPKTEGRRVAHRVAIGVWLGLSITVMLWWARQFYLGQWSS